MHRPGGRHCQQIGSRVEQHNRAKLWDEENDTKAKINARQRLHLQRMTPEKATLVIAIKSRQYTARQIVRAQSTGEKFEPRISLAFRDAAVAAASEAHELSNKQMAADADVDADKAVDVDVDAGEVVDADVHVDEAADAAVAAPPVSTKRKAKPPVSKALDIWPVKYNFI
jgi:hypothetical protein